jgi:hypothetical protein
MKNDNWFSDCIKKAKAANPVPQQVIDCFDGKLQAQLYGSELTAKNITQVSNQLIKTVMQTPVKEEGASHEA